MQGIFLSDFSRRHTGGLKELSKNFFVESLLIPKFLGVPSDLQPLRKNFLQRGDVIPVTDRAGFQVLDVVQGHVFLLIYCEGKRILLLPTWKEKILKGALPHLKSLSPIDVLVLPAWGDPSEEMGREILSSVLPAWVILSKRKPSLNALIDFLEKEEIPVFGLSDTGALRLEMTKDNSSLSPFILLSNPKKSLH